MKRCSGVSLRGLLALAIWAAYGVGARAVPNVATLPNGLRVVVSPEPGASRVGAVLMVRAGDADDPDGAPGAARVLGRLLLQPSNHAAPGRFARLRLQGDIWVDTEPDVTVFSIVTTPEQARAAVEYLAMASEEPSWNNTALLRSVGREGVADRERPPEDWERDFSAWQARVGLPPPPAPDVAPPARETLRAVFETLYVPQRMVLAVTGAVDAEETQALAGRLFRAPRAPERPPRRPRPRTAPPRPPTGRYAFVGYAAPEATSPDAPAVEVMAAALGVGKSSRLFQRLRESEGAGYESGAVFPRRLAPSAVALFALSPGEAPAVAGELREVWSGLQAIAPDAWDAARERAAHAYALQHQTARDRAYWLAFWELSGAGAAHDARHADLLRGVFPEDIARATRRWVRGKPVSLP